MAGVAELREAGSEDKTVERGYIFGWCYCGAISFRVKRSAKVHASGFCSCESCRRAHSAPLYACCYVDSSDFELYRGKTFDKTAPLPKGQRVGEQLVPLKGNENVCFRHFCSECGSRIYNQLEPSTRIGFFLCTLSEHTQHTLPDKFRPREHWHSEEAIVGVSTSEMIVYSPAPMRPSVLANQHQTDFREGLGNALQACVASIFACELESVPNFVEDPNGYEVAIREWATSRNFSFYKLMLDGDANSVAQLNLVNQTLANPTDRVGTSDLAGAIMVRFKTPSKFPKLRVGSRVIVRGKSPRGEYGHCVVGRIVPDFKPTSICVRVDRAHDPHVSGESIVPPYSWVGAFVNKSEETDEQYTIVYE